MEAKRKGEEIPPNTAIDKDGNPTTDPEAALEGSILPFGGVKGYALSFMIEIMTGPLVNAAFGTKVTGTAGDYKEDCNKGDLFVAINPEKFVSIDAFKEQVEEFVTEIRESGNTFIPGDLEVKRIAENEKNGLEIDAKLYDIKILKIAENGGKDHKDMLIQVTDPELLAITGGIVQGMSGSPIIQNGKLIGAITHVLIDDPTKGYAIFAENMLETAQNVAEGNKLKGAS